MQNFKLEAATRTVSGKKVDSLRADSQVPGVIYGHGVKNTMVSVSAVPFDKLYAAAGESSLVDLVVDTGTPVKVLIHDVQRHPLTSAVTHVDFYQVKMTEKLTTHITITFDGESKAVKELGGTLVKAVDSVTVECLPSDLVHELHVDLGKLLAYGDNLTVADIDCPAGIAIENDPNDVIATVIAPKTEAEILAEDAAPVADVSAVEVVEKKGKEAEDKAGEDTAKK